MSAAAPPADARTSVPTHPRWALRAASPTAPAALEQPLAGRQFAREVGDADAMDSDDMRCAALPPAGPWGHSPREEDDADASPFSDEPPPAGLRCAALPSAGQLPPAGQFDGVPLGAGERPSFTQATLAALCREASDIGAQLALAHAMALTFRRAVRDYIPVDDLDITPCLSAGVIDVLDAQVHRLDTLRDHLTRAFYGAAHGSLADRSSPRTTRALDTEEAGVGRHAVRRTR